MDWTVSPWNSYVEGLTPNVTVVGDRAYKEVIKVQWNHTVGSSSDRTWAFPVFPAVSLPSDNTARRRLAVCKPGRGLSLESDHAGTLILNFQPPKLWENKLLCWSPPVYGILPQQPQLIQASNQRRWPPYFPMFSLGSLLVSRSILLILTLILVSLHWENKLLNIYWVSDLVAGAKRECKDI